MYLGKPALATAKDPFGTRLSGRSNRSNPRLQEKGTPVHGAESADALSHYKPKFSRRAQQNATKRHADKGISLSDDSRTQPTSMTHTHRGKPSKDGGSGLGTSSLSDMHQPWPGAPSGRPLDAPSQNDQGYPWKMEVQLSSLSPGQSQPTQSKQWTQAWSSGQCQEGTQGQCVTPSPQEGKDKILTASYRHELHAWGYL